MKGERVMSDPLSVSSPQKIQEDDLRACQPVAESPRPPSTPHIAISRYGDGRPYQFVLGHRVFYDWACEAFRYEDGELMLDPPQRPCVQCGLPPVAGHDACIVDLPGAIAACCGHGVWEAYAWFGGDERITAASGDELKRDVCRRSEEIANG